MKKKTNSTLKKIADKLFSTVVRQEERCEWCGKTDNLQCAHIISRNNLTLRYDLENALCLCAGCHFKWHQSPTEAIRWLDKTFPGRIDYLHKRQNIITKMKPAGYENLIADLRTMIV